MKLCDIMSSLIIDDNGDILASNLLDSDLGGRLVYGVAKGIKQIAEERGESIEQVIEDIIEEQEDNRMEELLNKLIEKGWKPFGVKVKSVRVGIYCTNYFFFEGWAEGKTLRELCAKESNLWQFVCENGMIKEDKDKKEERYMYECEYTTGSHSTINYLKHNIYTKEYFYQYRLIESALCDEDKLEQFLLNNIKIDE